VNEPVHQGRGLALPALVLTAGLGSRLFPLTLTRAKPAAPVAGVPLIDRILRWLAAQQVGDAVLNLHHKPETIGAIVGDGSGFGIRVRYSWEHPRILGSAGGPRHALPLLGDRFLIVNGDTLTDVPLARLIDRHLSTGAEVTLALVPNREPLRYGGVLVADDGAVVEFTRRGDPRRSWHFVGLQVAEARTFAGLDDGVCAESVGGIYRGMIGSRPGSVQAWCTDGVFVDIGTPADYLRANLAFAAREGSGGRLVAPTSRVAPSARVTDCVIWENAVVSAGAVLERCVVADGVVIPEGAHYRESAFASTCAMTPTQQGLPAGARIDGDLIVVAF
jgi:NDP-sugar pyrophosphorylase family protein